MPKRTFSTADTKIDPAIKLEQHFKSLIDIETQKKSNLHWEQLNNNLTNVFNNCLKLGTKIEDFIPLLMPHSIKAFEMPKMPLYAKSQKYSVLCKSIKQEQDKNLRELKNTCFQLNLTKNSETTPHFHKDCDTNNLIGENNEQKIEVKCDKSKHTHGIKKDYKKPNVLVKCPFDNCNKVYKSRIAAKLHIRNKHKYSENSKKDLEQCALSLQTHQSFRGVNYKRVVFKKMKTEDNSKKKGNEIKNCSKTFKEKALEKIQEDKDMKEKSYDIFSTKSEFSSGSLEIWDCNDGEFSGGMLNNLGHIQAIQSIQSAYAMEQEYEYSNNYQNSPQLDKENYQSTIDTECKSSARLDDLNIQKYNNHGIDLTGNESTKDQEHSVNDLSTKINSLTSYHGFTDFVLKDNTPVKYENEHQETDENMFEFEDFFGLFQQDDSKTTAMKNNMADMLNYEYPEWKYKINNINEKFNFKDN